MPYKKLDRHLLVIRSLAERRNKVNVSGDFVSPGTVPDLSDEKKLTIGLIAARIRKAVSAGNPVMLTFGAHTIKNGLSPVLISLMEKGWITHLATNGAGIIHAWEFSFLGMSSEDVKQNIKAGQFGIWEETGFYINMALVTGAFEGLGYGESVGRMISRQGLDIPSVEYLQKIAFEEIISNPSRAAAAIDLAAAIKEFSLKEGFLEIAHPWRHLSAQARAWELNIPFTGHPMIGHDIIYTHPASNGAAIGRVAQNDFLSFAESVSRIDGGVYISLGSAVMSPMVFEKSFSMARNIAIKENRQIDNHFIAVIDMAESVWDWSKGEPPADNPAYYLRYCKTFSRMGGEMHYLQSDNRDFLLMLHKMLNDK